MEENSSFDNFEMQLNETAKGFLRETAKWAYFLSIIGYIGLAFLVIIALFAGTIFSTMGNVGAGMNAFGAMGATFITVLYLVLAIIYFFPVYYLNKFASNLKAAFKENNTELLTNSLGYLKSHYKYIGIFTLVFVVLYALIIVFAIIGGAMSMAT